MSQFDYSIYEDDNFSKNCNYERDILCFIEFLCKAIFSSYMAKCKQDYSRY